MNQQRISLQAEVPLTLDGERLDVAASNVFSQYSRSRLQQWIKEGLLLVDGKAGKTRDAVREGQKLALDVVLEIPAEDALAQPVALDVVHEDESILVINKPAGLVVHPGAGNADNTVMNGLLYRWPELAHVPRAGIVHRLDKDTTGLFVVAKNLEAHHALVSQLQERSVSRNYYAVVQGVMTAGGTVDKPIGRHASHRQKQAVVDFGGKEAVTHYRVVKRFRAHTQIRCMLETGRTHQIRVHMASVRFPLVGDKLYAGRPKIPKGSTQEMIDALQQFPRQALHAYLLGLIHPQSGEYCQWEAPMPEDMQVLLDTLQKDLEENR